MHNIRTAAALALTALVGACDEKVSPPPLVIRDPASWMVFFDYGSVALTEQSRKTLSAASTEWVSWMRDTRTPTRYLCVIGHADNADPEAINKQVSRQRAEVVIEYLIDQGMPRERMGARGVGSARPLVTTPPNTREHQNRFVELVFGFTVDHCNKVKE